MNFRGSTLQRSKEFAGVIQPNFAEVIETVRSRKFSLMWTSLAEDHSYMQSTQVYKSYNEQVFFACLVLTFNFYILST